MSIFGDFHMLQTNDEDFDDLSTAAHIQAEISKGKYAPPGGHVSILKEGNGEKKEDKTVLFIGGTSHSQGKQYGFSSDLFGLDIHSTRDTFKLEKIKQVKTFGITASSDLVRMENCSAIFGTNGATLVDMKDKNDDEFDAIMWGGQDSELIYTQNRLVEIEGDKKFEVESKDGKETKVSKIDATAYPAQAREFKDMPLPPNFNPEDEIVQKNTPIGRTNHTMGKLNDKELVMIGGLTIPEAGPTMVHPTDSTLWILNVETKTWTKCIDCEFTRRAGHTMHIHNNRIYILGGYTYMNSKPTKLHAINKLIEISLVSENITPIQREIDLAVPLHMPLQNLYGFAGTATDNNIYLFGGFTVTEYSDEEEDLYISHTPHSNRSTLLPRSSVLYHIDIEKKTLSAIAAPKEFSTANATIHVTDSDINGEADRILILGGTSQQIALFCKTKFEFEECHMQGEFGGCELREMTPTTVTNSCNTCGKRFHEDCDMFKHRKTKKGDSYKCPKCKGFGIQTVRPKVKGRRGGM